MTGFGDGERSLRASIPSDARPLTADGAANVLLALDSADALPARPSSMSYFRGVSGLATLMESPLGVLLLSFGFVRFGDLGPASVAAVRFRLSATALGSVLGGAAL